MYQTLLDDADDFEGYTVGEGSVFGKIRACKAYVYWIWIAALYSVRVM